MRRVLIAALSVAAIACATRTVRPARPSDAALADEVKRELLHAWNGYKQHAWGHDDLLPVSKTHRDWYGNGTAADDSGRYGFNARHHGPRRRGEDDR
jgi:hypothetical protein